MIGAGILDRLRRRDPGYRHARRGIRLTLAALPAYYVCLYGLGKPIMATYAVFGAIAAGLFIRLPGSARGRARVLLAALPMVWVLIALGTALDVNTWAAVGGMLVIGFAVAFLGVGGPRLVGLAGGLQLFYIVASFPPHHPEVLPDRLIGATVGVVLVAVVEVLLWPDPTPVPYQQRLCEATGAVADLLEASADVVAGRAAGDGEVRRHGDRATAAIERTRMAGLPRTERPTSASRRDRALRDGASTTREIAEQAQRFAARAELKRGHFPDVAAPMRQCAAAMRLAGRALSAGRLPSDSAALTGGAALNAGGTATAAATTGAATGTHADGGGGGGGPARSGKRSAGDGEPGTASLRRGPAGAVSRQPPDLDRLRLQTSLRTMIEHVDILAAAVRIALGQRGRPDGDRARGAPGALWYERRREFTLFWQQFRVHLTPRSVYFQGAIRLAVALAAARVVAGELNLSHGFWVLLGTLTIMRTSAANTRITLLSATLGTVIGAVATGLLLRFTDTVPAYVVELTIVTLLAFAVGPLLGLAWAQAMITMMVTLVFAQLAPTDWPLAGVRLLDVLVGGLVGILAGLLMWPKGAAGELRRRTGAYLKVGGDLIEETVASLAGHDWPGEALHAARREFILADASLCQYYSERPDPSMSQVHWDASLVAGHHIAHGAELVLHHNPVGSLASWPEAVATVTDIAGQLRRGYRDVAGDLLDGRLDRLVATPVDGAAIGERVTGIVVASDSRSEDSRLLEVEDWLANLGDNLGWIATVSRSSAAVAATSPTPGTAAS